MTNKSDEIITLGSQQTYKNNNKTNKCQNSLFYLIKVVFMKYNKIHTNTKKRLNKNKTR